MKTPNRMAPENWQEGDLVMLSCFLHLHDGKLHPNCGQIGQITKIAASDNDNMIVELGRDELVGRSTFLILPRKYFLPIPEFICEQWSARAGHTAWRVTERGRGLFKDMDWPSTVATFGGEA